MNFYIKIEKSNVPDDFIREALFSCSYVSDYLYHGKGIYQLFCSSLDESSSLVVIEHINTQGILEVSLHTLQDSNPLPSTVERQTYIITWSIPDDFSFLLAENESEIKSLLSKILSAQEIIDQRFGKQGCIITVCARAGRITLLERSLNRFISENSHSIPMQLTLQSEPGPSSLADRLSFAASLPFPQETLPASPVPSDAIQKSAFFVERSYAVYVPKKEVFFSLEFYNEAELLHRYDETEQMLCQKFPKEAGCSVVSSIPREQINKIYDGGFFWIVGIPAGFNVVASELTLHQFPGTVGAYVNLNFLALQERFTEELWVKAGQIIERALPAVIDGTIAPEIKKQLSSLWSDFIKKLSFTGDPRLAVNVLFCNKDEIKQKLKQLHVVQVYRLLIDCDVLTIPMSELQVLFTLCTDCLPPIVRDEAKEVWNCLSVKEKLDWLTMRVSSERDVLYGFNERLFHQNIEHLRQRIGAEKTADSSFRPVSRRHSASFFEQSNVVPRVHEFEVSLSDRGAMPSHVPGS